MNIGGRKSNARRKSAVSDRDVEPLTKAVGGASRWAGPGGICAADLVSRSAHAQVVQFHELANAVRRQMAQGTTLLAVPPMLLPLVERAQGMVASLLDAGLESVNAYGRMCVRKAVEYAEDERRSR